jgi:hypothetical protein
MQNLEKLLLICYTFLRVVKERHKSQMNKPLPIRAQEGYQWLHRLLMGSICLKLQAAPFQDGFPVSRQTPFFLSASRFVANAKNAFFCGLSTTPSWSAMRVATLEQHLQMPTDCLPQGCTFCQRLHI